MKRVLTEHPRHTVRITQPFYLGKYELTQAEWNVVMETNPSANPAPNNPVEGVSWEDVKRLLAKINAAYGDAGITFSLPTEAQWEYACRAGTATAYCYGDRSWLLRDYGWFEDNSSFKTNPVGEKKANAWGLHDMHGNVWEWCMDWFGGDYYRQSPLDDPTGPEIGFSQVTRGGCWRSPPEGCRSAVRGSHSPLRGYDHLGVRLACKIPYTPGTRTILPETAATGPSDE
jgi:formylglycine-generating enzyme required for sulfatase activity